MNNHDFLTESELDWLSDILLYRIPEDADTTGKDEGILDVSELDGFLTAIVSGPTMLVPSQWMPAMWGDFEAVWESLEDYQTFMSLLTQHSNSIVATLMDAPETFEPLFLQRTIDEEVILIVDEWCEGYMRGVHLASQAWIDGGKQIMDLLEPIRAFTEESDWAGHDLQDAAVQTQLRDSITPNARGIHAFWLAQRSDDQMTYRREQPRIGRNDPCPCGSGKKYKRCCLH